MIRVMSIGMEIEQYAADLTCGLWSIQPCSSKRGAFVASNLHWKTEAQKKIDRAHQKAGSTAMGSPSARMYAAV